MINHKRLAPLFMNDGGDGGGGGGGGDGGDGGESTVAADQAWNHGFNDEQNSYAEAKGFSSGASLLQAAQNGEQFISKTTGGKDLSQIIYRPNMDAPDEVSAFYRDLGMPESADGYENVKVADGQKVTEGADAWFKDLAHKHNLSVKQAEGIWGEWSEFSTKEVNGIYAQNEERDALGKQNLQKQWGADFQQNLDNAAAAANALGITKEEVDAMQQVVGFEKTMQAFDRFAQAISDPSLLDGGDGKGEFTSGEAGYQAQIGQLKGDADFVKSLSETNHPSHKANKAKWENLHKLAYPGEQRFGFG